MSRDPRGRKAKDASGKTQQQLAGEAGVSLSTWKKWQAREGQEGSELRDEKIRAETRKIEVQTEREQRMLQILDLEYLPKEEVERSIAECGNVLNQFASSICSEFPSLLEGLAAPEIEREAIIFCEEWKRRARDAESNVWTAARTGIEKMLRGDLKKVAATKRKRDDGSD